MSTRSSTKGEWIRAHLKEHGAAVPYVDIAKAAKAAGLGELSKSYVSTVRVKFQKKLKAAHKKTIVEPRLPQPRAAALHALSGAGQTNGKHGATEEGTSGGAQFLKALRVIGSERGRKLLEIFENGGA